jgi:anthranilate synthase component 2
MKVLLLDNYDSFVYNLYQYLGELGAEPQVHRNDALDLRGVRAMDPDAVVISPGPGHPAVPRDFGVCREVLLEVSPHTPTLGVCLGHQGIAHVYGGAVVSAPTLLHGKTSVVHHDGEGVFEGVPNPVVGGRYHSLMADPSRLPPQLHVSARSEDGVIMGLRHRRYPVEGLQFHPESILTPHGKGILRNFLQGARR